MALSARRLQQAQKDPMAWLASSPQPPTSIPSMTTGYRVVGSQIFGPNNQPFIPRGVNIAAGLLTNGSGYPDFSKNEQYATDFVARGGNTVRIVTQGSSRYPWAPFTAGYTPVWNGPKLYGTDAVVAYTKATVDFWRAKGVVTLVECHDFTSTGYTPQQASECEDFWVAMANEYKSDTGVWFNLYNEPNTYDTPYDGARGGNVSGVRQRWVGLHARACKKIRDAGAPNIIVTDTFGYAGDSGKQWDGKPAPRGFDPEAAPLLSSMYGGIVLSWHNYGHHGVLTTHQKITEYVQSVHVAGIPLIMGEIGYPIRRGWDGISSVGWPYLRDATDQSLETVPPLGVGILFWSSNFHDGFSLYKPFWGPNPSGGGNGAIINEFAETLPEGYSLSGQGVRFMQYLATGQSVPNTGPSHSGASAPAEE